MKCVPGICKKLKNLLADSNHCEQIVQMSNRRLQRTEKKMTNLNLRISFKNRIKRGLVNVLGRGISMITGNMSDKDKEEIGIRLEN
jgi:hypothetical protein